jgi:hypothetical protein
MRELLDESYSLAAEEEFSESENFDPNWNPGGNKKKLTVNE